MKRFTNSGSKLFKSKYGTQKDDFNILHRPTNYSHYNAPRRTKVLYSDRGIKSYTLPPYSKKCLFSSYVNKKSSETTNKRMNSSNYLFVEGIKRETMNVDQNIPAKFDNERRIYSVRRDIPEIITEEEYKIIKANDPDVTLMHIGGKKTSKKKLKNIQFPTSKMYDQENDSKLIKLNRPDRPLLYHVSLDKQASDQEEITNLQNDFEILISQMEKEQQDFILKKLGNLDSEEQILFMKHIIEETKDFAYSKEASKDFELSQNLDLTKSQSNDQNMIKKELELLRKQKENFKEKKMQFERKKKEMEDQISKEYQKQMKIKEQQNKKAYMLKKEEERINNVHQQQVQQANLLNERTRELNKIIQEMNAKDKNMPQQVIQKEVVDKEVVNKEVVNKEVVNKEIVNKEVVNKEVVNKEVVNKEIVNKEVVNKEVVKNAKITKRPLNIEKSQKLISELMDERNKLTELIEKTQLDDPNHSKYSHLLIQIERNLTTLKNSLSKSNTHQRFEKQKSQNTKRVTQSDMGRKAKNPSKMINTVKSTLSQHNIKGSQVNQLGEKTVIKL